MENKDSNVKWAKILAAVLAVLLICAIVSALLGAATALAALFDGAETPSAPSASGSGTAAAAIYSAFTDIKAEGFVGTITFVEGDDYAAEVRSGAETLTLDGGTLVIGRSGGFDGFIGGLLGTREPCDAVVTVPRGTVLHSVSIECVGGGVLVDGAETDLLRVEAGAGELRLRGVSAMVSADIDGGAGRLIFEDCTLYGAELDLGVGKTEFSGALRGAASVDCGIGAVELDIDAPVSDYTVRVSIGIGGVTVDGRLVGDGNVIGSGPNVLELNCGIGGVGVTFR